jgi:hypothetical protein
MPESSIKYGLTRSGRGWYKRIGKRPRWIVSAKLCPTGEDADAYYEANFSEIAKRAPVRRSAVTLRQAAGAFVGEKEAARLHRDTIRDYEDVMLIAMRAASADRAVASLDMTAADALTRAVAHLGTARRLKYVVYLRGFIAWCARQGIACGWTRETFRPPKKSERRRDRASRRKPVYTHNEIRRLLRHASDRMRAVILLAVNCAMGPDELTKLTDRDVRGGVIDKPRQKTGVDRLVPLWPETIASLPKRSGLLFPGPGGKPLDPVRLTRRFHAICSRAAVPPRGLYHLRRTFRTIADGFGDHRAAAKVMGRELPDIDSIYVLTIDRERIERMLAHVKSSLRIGRALAARRYLNGQRGLALRVARRASKAKQSAPSARIAKPRRRADQG